MVFMFMRIALSRILHFVGRFVLRVSGIIYNSPKKKTLKQWYSHNGEDTLRIFYNLSPSSIVLDLGGFRGQWASDIFACYSCNIHVFEPVPEFAYQIRKRFSHNDKVILHEFCLGSKNGSIHISVDGPRSSTYQDNGRVITSQVVDVVDFVNLNQIKNIDLLKVNIEGAEYDLLEYLIATRLILRVKNIQVQFHEFVTNAESRMQTIQNALNNTHRPTYQYRFIWENWELLELKS